MAVLMDFFVVGRPHRRLVSGNSERDCGKQVH